MSMKRALQIVFGIALLGLAFSGVLTYRELFAGPGTESCQPVGTPGTILGSPPCVYGFFMYLAIVVISGLGLRQKGDRTDGNHAAWRPST